MMHTDTPIRRLLAISGRTLSVLDQGEGPAVLLGHGFLWDWRMWQPQVEALKSRYRLIVPEMWGHGQSGSLPSGTETLADIASQMLAVMDQLEIRTFAVAGSSLGGMWGAHLAAMAPQRVTSLALMNTYLSAEPEMNRQTYFAMLDQVAREGRVNDAVAATIAPLFFAPGSAPILKDRLQVQIERFGANRLRQSIVPLGKLIFGRDDALDLLDRIAAPTLIVAGRQDASRPAAESIVMAGRLGVAAHIIDACGHSATLEQPDHVNALLDEFLTRTSRSPAMSGCEPVSG
ncbi:alpha/beta fold hydrolase [Blastomonas sp.]|uniref:alpha/beta fold hydrolase n=1 Tax=Blastomonas sp. TaxID=1909299 RepID=UPI00391D439E